MTSCARILNVPPIPAAPEPLRGRSFVLVEAVYAGDEEHGAELVRPLRDLGPEMDTLATIPMPALSRLHMDPEHPVAGFGDGMLLAEFPAEAVAAIADHVGADSPLLTDEFRQLGGALGEPAPGHGALAALEGGFALYAAGPTMSPEMHARVAAAIDELHSALTPWGEGQVYLNFAARKTNPGTIFGAETYDRLRRVKTAYDPHDLFRSNHPVAPAPRAARRTPSVRLATRPRPRRAARGTA
jgi:hypothetical protein